LKVKGKIRYHWPGNGIDESLRFRDSTTLNKEPYDIVIVGAGLVGCALAYQLSQYQCRVLLVDKEYFVGEGTSKANSALLITGFDTQTGSLETQLCTEASQQWPDVCRKLKIPYESCGCIIAAFNTDEVSVLKEIHQQARANGVDDVCFLCGSDVRKMEPRINPKVQAGIYSPREAIGDPFGTTIAFTEAALINGVDILLGITIVGVESESGSIKSLITLTGKRIRARILVNVSGLGSRELANQYGGEKFDINPRRGQFLVLDKSSRSLVKGILLPSPHPVKGRGVLVIPTIYGGLLAGPTAEDLPYGTKNPTDTTEEVMQTLLSQAALLCPEISDQPVISHYAGARCNCTQGSYIIRYNDGLPGTVTVTGIRSTGFTTCLTLADYLIEGLVKKCSLSMTHNPIAVDSRPENSCPSWWGGKFKDSDLVKKNPAYGRIVCTCQQISEGKIADALNSPLQPATLNAIKRMTLARMGRCQGYGCLIELAEILSKHHRIPLQEVTINGPGSEWVNFLEAI
jgi:glycerol-3-phosphate dehydrogenase